MAKAGDARANLWVAAAVIVALAALAVIVAAAALAMAGDKRAPGLDLGALPERTRQAYLLAEGHRDLFAHLPCYCGCAALPVPHRSLTDCFLNPAGGYDSHASGCSTCVDIAFAAVAAAEDGLDHTAVRALVDAQFSDRGPSTLTPYP